MGRSVFPDLYRGMEFEGCWNCGVIGKMIHTNIEGIDLTFETNEGVFSPAAVDTGTLAMLSAIQFSEEDKVLDLGCGYGVVGILAAKIIGEKNVVMCDNSEAAVALAKQNVKRNHVQGVPIRLSNAYEEIPEQEFTLILSNPPYHTDFAVAKEFIETGFQKLAVGGKLCMVTKRLDWYRNKLSSVFGGVRVLERDGYYVFISEKRQNGKPKKKEKPPQQLSRKLRRKYSK